MLWKRKNGTQIQNSVETVSGELSGAKASYSNADQLLASAIPGGNLGIQLGDSRGVVAVGNAPLSPKSVKIGGRSFVVPLGYTISGSVVVQGALSVRGVISGPGIVAGQLDLCPSGVLNAPAEVGSAVVSGEARAPLKAKQSVLISQSAKVFGGIRSPELKVERGAKISGPLSAGPVSK